LETIHAGHPDVEQHAGGLRLVGALKERLAILPPLRAVAGRPQEKVERAADRFFVVDDVHQLAFSHRPIPFLPNQKSRASGIAGFPTAENIG
jgi:hypothetical protein